MKKWLAIVSCILFALGSLLLVSCEEPQRVDTSGKSKKARVTRTQDAGGYGGGDQDAGGYGDGGQDAGGYGDSGQDAGGYGDGGQDAGGYGDGGQDAGGYGGGQESGGYGK